LRIAAAGIGVHILGDLITSFGTMIFAPVSDRRVEWGTTFIIDPWFSGIIVVALLFAWLWRGARTPAIVGIIVLCAYVGLQWTQKNKAIEFGQRYAGTQGLSAAVVQALPRPVSPFNWMVIVADRESYRYTFVNLRRGRVQHAASDAGFIARLDAHYLPVDQAVWQHVTRFGEGKDQALGREVWRQEGFAFFRWFAAFPVLVAVEHGNPSLCVWFRDLRFLTPGREAWPFRYGMCRAQAGPWVPYEFPDGETAFAVGKP
jgi:inner membrane protein